MSTASKPAGAASRSVKKAPPKRASRAKPAAGAAEEAAESTRDRVLRVATELFSRNGYHGTGMTELGEEAGLQRGALYYHIGSKEQLLYDVCTLHIHVALAYGSAAVATSDDARVQFRALVHAHLRTLAERRDDVVTAEREMHALSGDWAKQFVKLRHQYQDLFTSVLERGVEQGHFTRASSVDVFGVLGMLNYTYVWLDPRGPIPVEEVADRLHDLLVQGLSTR